MAISRAGQIVLCRFPQTDFAPGKRRPALLLLPLPSEYNDWLVCMMSTKTAHSIPSVDELMTDSDSDFDQSGLKEDTLIRLTRLAAVTDSLFTGSIGAGLCVYTLRLISKQPEPTFERLRYSLGGDKWRSAVF